MTSATQLRTLTTGGLDGDRVADLDATAVEARSFPRTPVSPAEVREAGWTRSDLWLPAVVLDGAALTHNLTRFARWCAERGVDLAPHGKTTMAPALWSAQLASGAWGLTCATVAQARTMHAVGVPRVIVANEVLDPPQLRWLAQAADPARDDFDACCLVDDEAGVALMEQALEGTEARLEVLVELGVPGRRTGVRGVEAALAVARRVARSPHLVLAGVEAYEGVLPTRRDDEAVDRARGWLEGLADLVRRADAEGLFTHLDEVLVTAGGSAFPDLAADGMAALAPLSRPVRRVVRSGCYVSHDDLSYERSSPLRSGAEADPLLPALTCCARVISCPEPGRALLGVGKRDVAFDIDLPLPRAVLRDGERTTLPSPVEVVELNDHHGFCDDPGGALRPGDVVELGLSHPCTVFDKWSLIPVLDDEARVVDAVRTLF